MTEGDGSEEINQRIQTRRKPRQRKPVMSKEPVEPETTPPEVKFLPELCGCKTTRELNFLVKVAEARKGMLTLKCIITENFIVYEQVDQREKKGSYI